MRATPWSRSDERAWRALVSASVDPESPNSALAEMAKRVGGARIPSRDKRDMLAFAALQAVARACGEAKRERRAILQPLLATLAVECATSVGWSAEQPEKAAAEDRSWTSRDLFSQVR